MEPVEVALLEPEHVALLRRAYWGCGQLPLVAAKVRNHNERKRDSMRPNLALITILTAMALSGCAATTVSKAPSPPPASTHAAPSCTSSSCITTEIQHDLIGLVAKDEAVITKASCDPAALTRNAGGTYTAPCTVTESDGSVSTGDGNLLPAQGEITYDFKRIVRMPG